MPGKAFEFEYAEFAITTPDSAPLLQPRVDDICDGARPRSVLDHIRQLAHYRDAEPRLADANARASRDRASSCPLADLTKLPQRFSLAPEVQ